MTPPFATRSTASGSTIHRAQALDTFIRTVPLTEALYEPVLLHAIDDAGRVGRRHVH